MFVICLESEALRNLWNAMTGLHPPTLAEPWRVLGNIADEIVTRLEKPHSRQVDRAFIGDASPDLRSPGGEARRDSARHELASDARTWEIRPTGRQEARKDA